MIIELFPLPFCSLLTVARISFTPGFTDTGTVTSKDPPEVDEETVSVPDSPISALVNLTEEVGAAPELFEIVPIRVILAAPYVWAMILMPRDSEP